MRTPENLPGHRPWRHRWLPAGMVVGCVMLAHGVLALSLADELRPAAPTAPKAPRLMVMGVSAIAALPLMPATLPDPPSPVLLPMLPAAAKATALIEGPVPAPVVAQHEPGAESLAIPLVPESTPPQGQAPVVVAATAAAQAADAPMAPPVYPTKPPQSTTLRYDLSKGLIRASGELRWRVDGSNYDAVLEGSFLGLEVLDWHSTGRFDAAGLAPNRFTDQRKGGATRAANFQRDKGLITYSGPDTTFRLHPGAQDRLSWMVQLAAVANARAAGWMAGDRITFFVTGARGDASMWHFSVIGKERLNLTTGASDTWHLVREADSARETRVDVWIDPALQNLPVRARMAQSDGDALELRLTGVRASP